MPAPDYAAVQQAVTGGESCPRQWRLNWLDCLLIDVERSIEHGEFHAYETDPASTDEMIREVRTLAAGLRLAFAPLAAEQTAALQREADEAAAVRRELDLQFDGELPF